MNFRVIHQKTPSGAHSPYQVIEQPSGRRVGWINRFLDRERCGIVSSRDNTVIVPTFKI